MSASLIGVRTFPFEDNADHARKLLAAGWQSSIPLYLRYFASGGRGALWILLPNDQLVRVRSKQ